MIPILFLLLKKPDEDLNLGPPPLWVAYLFVLIMLGFDVAIFWDAYKHGML